MVRMMAMRMGDEDDEDDNDVLDDDGVDGDFDAAADDAGCAGAEDMSQMVVVMVTMARAMMIC